MVMLLVRRRQRGSTNKVKVVPMVLLTLMFGLAELCACESLALQAIPRQDAPALLQHEGVAEDWAYAGLEPSRWLIVVALSCVLGVACPMRISSPGRAALGTQEGARWQSCGVDLSTARLCQRAPYSGPPR
jgi:hypothetical protein